jgi:hypothetical protein
MLSRGSNGRTRELAVLRASETSYPNSTVPGLPGVPLLDSPLSEPGWCNGSGLTGLAYITQNGKAA